MNVTLNMREVGALSFAGSVALSAVFAAGVIKGKLEGPWDNVSRMTLRQAVQAPQRAIKETKIAIGLQNAKYIVTFDLDAFPVASLDGGRVLHIERRALHAEEGANVVTLESYKDSFIAEIVESQKALESLSGEVLTDAERGTDFSSIMALHEKALTFSKDLTESGSQDVVRMIQSAELLLALSEIIQKDEAIRFLEQQVVPTLKKMDELQPRRSAPRSDVRTMEV